MAVTLSLGISSRGLASMGRSPRSARAVTRRSAAPAHRQADNDARPSSPPSAVKRAGLTPMIVSALPAIGSLRPTFTCRDARRSVCQGAVAQHDLPIAAIESACVEATCDRWCPVPEQLDEARSTVPSCARRAHPAAEDDRPALVRRNTVMPANELLVFRQSWKFAPDVPSNRFCRMRARAPHREDSTRRSAMASGRHGAVQHAEQRRGRTPAHGEAGNHRDRKQELARPPLLASDRTSRRKVVAWAEPEVSVRRPERQGRLSSFHPRAGGVREQ
jgi:hypothetical protein